MYVQYLVKQFPLKPYIFRKEDVANSKINICCWFFKNSISCGAHLNWFHSVPLITKNSSKKFIYLDMMKWCSWHYPLILHMNWMHSLKHARCFERIEESNIVMDLLFISLIQLSIHPSLKTNEDYYYFWFEV